MLKKCKWKPKCRPSLSFISSLTVPVDLFSGVIFCFDCKGQTLESWLEGKKKDKELPKMLSLLGWLSGSGKWLKLDLSLGSAFGCFKDLCPGWLPSPEKSLPAIIHLFVSEGPVAQDYNLASRLSLLNSAYLLRVSVLKPSHFAFSHGSCVPSKINLESRATYSTSHEISHGGIRLRYI